MGDRGPAPGTMLKVSIACLCLAALIAIGALLAGNYGETEAKVTLTTLAVAIYNLTGMAGVAARSHPRLATLGLLGIATAVIAFVLVLPVIWADWENGDDEDSLVQAWGIATVLTISLAQASMLMLRRRDDDGNAVWTVLLGTLAAIAAVALLLMIAILNEFEDIEDGFYRVLGVFGVLDVLGMLVTPLLRRLQAGGRATSTTTEPGATRTGSEALAHRLGLEQDALARGDAFELPHGGLAPRLDAALAAGAELVLPRTDLGERGALAVVRGADGRLVALIERPPRRSES